MGRYPSSDDIIPQIKPRFNSEYRRFALTLTTVLIHLLYWYVETERTAAARSSTKCWPAQSSGTEHGKLVGPCFSFEAPEVHEGSFPMLNVANQSLVVCSDGVTTIQCARPQCRHSIKTIASVSAGVRYVCRHHSPVHRHVNVVDS